MACHYLSLYEAEKEFNLSRKTLDRLIGANKLAWSTQVRNGREVRVVNYDVLASRYEKRNNPDLNRTGQIIGQAVEDRSVFEELMKQIVIEVKEGYEKSEKAYADNIIYFKNQLERECKISKEKKIKLLEAGDKQKIFENKIQFRDHVIVSLAFLLAILAFYVSK